MAGNSEATNAYQPHASPPDTLLWGDIDRLVDCETHAQADPALFKLQGVAPPASFNPELCGGFIRPPMYVLSSTRATRILNTLDLFAAIRAETFLNELNERPKSFDHASGECRLVIRDTVDNFVTDPTDCLNLSQLGVRNHSIVP